MPKKLTLEEFIKKAREVHGSFYNYDKVNYVENKTKVEIICPKPGHGSFWQTPANHCQGRGCPSCKYEGLSKKFSLTAEKFIEKAKEVHPYDEYDYSEIEYKNNDTKVKIICKVCGRTFFQTPRDHLSGRGCSHCKGMHIKRTCMKKYGCENPSQVPEFQEKYKKNSLEKYGYEHPHKSPEFIENLRKENLKNYGVEWAIMRPDVQNKIRKTNQSRFGVDSPLSAPEIIEKARQTWIEKYGVEHPSQSKCIKDKIVNTKRKNGTFAASQPEENLHHLLIDHFGEDDISRNDNTHPEYPFAVDFYIKSRGLFIEYNGLWTHGKHWFDPTSESDKEIITKWKEKDTKYYRNAINVWSVKDHIKRQTAKENNLNYVTLWNWKDIEEWFAIGCPDGQDWNHEYTWKEG